MKKINSQSGFTLIEIMLYFTIAGLFLFAISSFALGIIDASRLSENVNEIQDSSTFFTEKIVEKIHSSSGLDTINSIFDNDTGKLSLNGLPNSSFYLSAGNAYMKEGIDNPIKLNSNSVTVNKLRFHRVTSAKTPDQIVINGEFATMVNISNLAHTYPFHLSVSLRK